MKKYIGILKNTKLFSGVGEDEIASMLDCLGATLGKYQKGEYVIRAGEHIHHIYVLTEGKLLIQNDDYWGNRSIINRVIPGEMFGEAYASPGSGAILNDVVAVEDSTVICFNVNKVLSVCPSGCRFHTLTVKNLFFAISEKNRTLLAKLGHMSNRTTRDKLLSYLSAESQKRNSPSFDIPFNRQQLADFLSVDRSAMSNELCKMRDEGLIKFEKSHFELL